MSKEAVERTILDFHPGHTVRCGERVSLGKADSQTAVFYGYVTYPVDIAAGRPGIIALAYAEDIRVLPEGLAEKVAARLIPMSGTFDALYQRFQSMRFLQDRVHGEWDV